MRRSHGGRERQTFQRKKMKTWLSEEERTEQKQSGEDGIRCHVYLIRAIGCPERALSRVRKRHVRRTNDGVSSIGKWRRRIEEKMRKRREWFRYYLKPKPGGHVLAPEFSRCKMGRFQQWAVKEDEKGPSSANKERKASGFPIDAVGVC